MATYSSILAWRIPGTEEPGGLLSMGSHRVGHDWSDLATAAADPQLFFIFLTQFLVVLAFSPSTSVFFFQYLLTPVSTLTHTVNIKHYFNYLIKKKFCPGAAIFPLNCLALHVFVILSWPCLHLIYFLSVECYHKTRIVLTSCLLQIDNHYLQWACLVLS